MNNRNINLYRLHFKKKKNDIGLLFFLHVVNCGKNHVKYCDISISHLFYASYKV